MGTISREYQIWTKNEITIELQKLYIRGKGGINKYSRITAEKVYNIFHETVIKSDWEKKTTLSVPKIKLLFSNTPEKMAYITEQMEIDGDREEKYNMEYLYLQDSWLVMETI